MKEVKFLGITLRKGEVNLKSVPAGKKRARYILRPIPKREVSWQIEDIRTALQMAKNPDYPDRYKLFQIFEYVLKDSHLKSQIRVAKAELLSEPWQIYVNDKVDAKTSKALIKRWFNTIIEFILETEWNGFSLVECDKVDPANFAVGEVTLIPRDYVSIEKQQILIEGSIFGNVLPYGDIMTELDLLEFGRRKDYGVLVECAYNVIWKYYARSDWSRGSEKFGMPILAIEADTNNDDELDRIEQRASTFGTDGYIVTQKGDTAKIIERAGQRLHDIWLDNIKLCNEEVSKCINGQTGSSDPKAFVGAAQVQERTMEAFTYTRLQNIVDEVNEKVLPYLKAKGFAIPEGAKFDYPALIRERERRLNGPLIPTSTPDQQDPNNPDPAKPNKPNKPNKPQKPAAK
ncbi:MAG: phage portal protein family protein [Ginsengibacter sp.]